MANKEIKSINLLPEFLRTSKNSKFLASTIDQLIQPPSLERVDGYIGSTLTPTYQSTSDIYISETLPLRRNYQLEPAMVIRSDDNSVTDVIGIDDLTNEISLHGGSVNNLDRLYRTDFYSYNPHISWDKFVNYQEYYWLVTGPNTVVITGQPKNTTSTYVVKLNQAETSFIFDEEGLVEDPIINLYRGNTYHFEVDSKFKFYIKTSPTTGDSNQFNLGVTNNGISTGTITIVVNENTPDTLFYTSNDQQYTRGQFNVRSIDQDSVIDVDAEIVGKKDYSSGTGAALSNGMKVRFGGTVYPESYRDKEFWVEGVGKGIKLIEYSLLSSSEGIANVYDENFDATAFDSYPYDTFKSLPINPEYITINRASRDLNPWTRYNRWVHGDVIRSSAVANGQEPVYPADKRAKRPIIEFNADLKLYNFGTIGVKNVDLIDTYTLDAFSVAEGSPGYYVDGVLLEQGHRVIFNAETDPLVKGKIYKVNYAIINGKKKLELVQDEDFDPAINAAVSVNLGTEFAGSNWWYNGTSWVYSQQHTTLNQAPLFDLFDNDGHSYADTDYHISDFAGNNIFGYDVGTGSNDAVLGFPLKYENSVGVGSYLFKNYFMTEVISILKNGQVVEQVPTSQTYTKTGDMFTSVWQPAENYTIPILQFQATTSATSKIQLTAIDNPVVTDFTFEVFVNNNKIDTTEYTTTATSDKFFVKFNQDLSTDTDVLFKIYTDASANSNGYYEPPLSLTNNPLNGPISKLTLTELSDHVHTMVHKVPEFKGNFPGSSNLRDLPNIASYGSRLVASVNPISYAQFFIGKKEHNLIDALTKAADQYNLFKFALLKRISEIDLQTDPVSALDIALKEINADKDLLSPYFLSDMVPYGTDKIVRTWTITNSRNTVYPITSDYDPTNVELRAVLVYLNGVQLLLGTDYEFVVNDSSIRMLKSLSVGDVIVVNDYTNTEGTFVPPTPTKLGLYPKFTPEIFVDSTYINEPVTVIQGHDGSIMTAYGDYRDAIILEFEKRVYNNIKAQYNPSLIDINSILPGAFKNNKYSIDEVNQLLQGDFVKWAGFYGIDYTPNSSFLDENPFTWNYTGSYNSNLKIRPQGYWRGVYNYFYGTDRPHTHPWEMLGISEMPAWWEDEYGPAPYTSGNDLLWTDLEQGLIKQGLSAGINKLYARPGLSKLLPVNEYGELNDPSVTLASNITSFNRRQSWKFGDQGPAETAWRRSSYWPFAVQKLLALSIPATYASLMYDLSRLTKNIAGQWTYGSNHTLLNPKNVSVHDDNRTLTTGYSVYVSEVGQQRSKSYIAELKTDLANIDFNLFYKVGGFISKDKLQIVIDAIDPLSTSPGALLPQEDYELILNVSNPVSAIGISGIVVQKTNGKFIIKGYDQNNPYFTTYDVLRNTNTPTVTVGGLSETYVQWQASGTSGATGLSGVDTATASSSSTGKFYQAGQIVFYNGTYYRVKTSHQSGSSFNTAYFQALVELPTVGGATVQAVGRFDKTIRKIPYGTELNNIQEVYDVIVGYGHWLENQGFVFDEFNSDLQEIIDWKFTGKEFLYWTTQNWADNSVITLSPFADQIKFKFTASVVANIFDSFYEYSILQASGTPFPQKNLNVNRENGLCTITTTNTTEGIYFAVIRSVQKEHGMVFNNTTKFNDTIYDIETGYRQRRMKLIGFRTAGWDGDYFSPGFIYDTAKVDEWKVYTDYRYGDVVRFAGKYYSANKNTAGTAKFDFTKWTLLGEKPTPELLPNFDYKINQFEDFYSLDIDNFDSAQQKMAQHLTGYTPRVYLNNIFTNPISQYKFYQGFIKEKGTRNSVKKLAKATIHNLQGEIDFSEEWAFRVGHYGSFETYKELEIPLQEGQFIENPQIINFVDSKPTIPNDLIYYSTSSDRIIAPADYASTATFIVNNDTDPDFKIATAGYVRFDDITATAYNENSLLDIADNRSINEGDLIWLGFKKNGDWDVLRYTLVDARITGVFVSAPATEITFVTNFAHGLSVGDIISVSQFNYQVNGIYIVKSLPEINQFTVASTLSAIVNDELVSQGLLFKFASARYNTFDDLPNDRTLLRVADGEKIWVDNDGNDKWAVYEKTDNYDRKRFTFAADPVDQHLGWTVTKRRDNNLVAASAPNYVKSGSYGKIFVYSENTNNLNFQLSYGLNDLGSYQTTGSPTGFGRALVYHDINFNKNNESTGYGLFIAGAPLAGKVKSNDPSGGLRLSEITDAASTRVEEGLVKISSVDPVLLQENAEAVILSPSPSSYEQFGHSVAVERNSGKTTSTSLMLVGAPGTATTGSGKVYSFQITANPDSVTDLSLQYNGTVANPFTGTGSQFGYAIASTEDLTTVVISAPGYGSDMGAISIYTRADVNSSLAFSVNEFAINFIEGGRFGESICLSDDGKYLFVGSPEVRSEDQSYGKVFVYYRENLTSAFNPIQTIINPEPGAGMKFGKAISVDSNSSVLSISAMGKNKFVPHEFDGPTTFDAGSTNFYDTIDNAGVVYVYNKKGTSFKFAQEIKAITTASINFGNSIVVDDNSIYVGAPEYSTSGSVGAFYQYYKIDTANDSWSLLRNQEALTDLNSLQRVSLINSFDEEIVDYLDIIDPLKGKISGLAEQDLKYKSAFDPAVYSIGVAGTVNDTNTNWLDDHVGELWWDLSTVKYAWYEQGDLSYRKNNWGRIFPGATIDVYEWVGSSYLPSEWSGLADTPAGLTEGISGQPKFADNSVISVKQIYNSSSNSFSNYYYYWVKNKITVPSVKNRRTSSYQIASMIADPTAYGLKFASILSADSLALSNIGTQLIDNRMHLNIASDDIDNTIPRHTEWLLLKEGTPTSVPNTLLEKKLIDSLLGHDSLGNKVPDPSLSSRVRYGIGIRPRQGLFKDRYEALRNLLEFTNGVLLSNQITGQYSFANLNKQEQIPDAYSHEYDQIVEDNEGLLVIDTRQLIRGQLSCTIKDGKIRSVSIDNPGFGYKISPTVTINGNTSSAKITTEIDSFGQIISASIEDAGIGFTSAPLLIVRPYTAIVLADTSFNGKWSKFIFDIPSQSWVRYQTQKYNTTLYWNYADWQSSSYNQFVDFEATVDEVYEAEALDLAAGNYVKVKNGGDGRFIILERTESGIAGTFSDNFNLVYSQNGTIQISDAIWNLAGSTLGYDQSNSFDQTLYDQTPDLELQYILTALKKDIFVNELKVNWNLFFFKAVKYALSEQKLLDWAFKTSFINVTNYAGSLDQRPVYKLQNSEYYEQYLKEVKPYHTNIRSFTTNHTVLEPTQSYTTDFDLPSVYNKDTGKFESIDIGSDKLNSYPWKSWADNYAYQVGSISIGYAGSGYVVPPTVEVRTAPGDTGSGATAKAFIRSGEVISIEVTNPGSGYKKAPDIIITGGGNSIIDSALGYAQLSNGKVRANMIGMKFDRISKTVEIGNLTATDTFICNGSDNEFVLNWLAQADKSRITVSLDGSLVLSADYKIEYYRELTGQYGDYSKEFSKVVFLNYVPNIDQVLTVTYPKSTKILNALERIENYYSAGVGMPNTSTMLMSGLEYSKTRVEGLPFDYTSEWDKPYSSFGESAYADNIGYYKELQIVRPVSTGTDTVVLSTTTGIVIGQLANIISANKAQATTTFFYKQVGNPDADVTVVAINTTASTVKFSSTITQAIVTTTNYTYINNVKVGVLTTATAEFWTYDSNFSILDSAIDGGNLQNTTALGINPEDITIDGSGFLNPDSSYGPEELVPGEVNESLGINVYTKNTEGAPIIVTMSYDVQATNNYAGVYQLTGNAASGTNVLALDSTVGVFAGQKVKFASTTNIFVSTGTVLVDQVSPSTVMFTSPFARQVLASDSVEFYTGEFIGITRHKLTIQPPNKDSIYVTYNNKIYPYTSSTSFTTSEQFAIDWATNELVLPPQSVSDKLGVTVMSIGGGRPDTEAGVIDSASLTTTGFSDVHIESLAALGTVKSAYVSVNGVTYPQIETAGPYGYRLTYANSDNHRAAVEVYGMSTGTNTVIAWFLGTQFKNFNEVTEQVIPITSISQISFTLNNPPGNIEPVAGSAMVELTTTAGRKLLRPPHIDYYEFVNSSSNPFYINNAGNFDYSDVRVYLNGSILRPGFDYTIDSSLKKVSIEARLLHPKDVVAIVNLPTGEYLDFDYDIVGNTLSLKTPVASGQLRVISYNNHDDLFMRTERFDGTASRRYKISREVFNESYVWVSINGIPLISKQDYEILDDNRTIQISDAFVINPLDDIMITSFADTRLSATVLGYRIFNDMFNRTHFKRLSKENSTFLSRPLKVTDTEIYVNDSSVLTPPLPSKNIPGVILVDAERIEFFKITGNVLSQLRRGTLGTSPSFYCQENTKVIDQSPEQTIPFTEQVLKQHHFTTSTVSTKVTSTATDSYTFVINTGTFATLHPWTTATLHSDGIILQYNPVDSLLDIDGNTVYADPVDQIDVYYRGRKLNKAGTYQQDTTLSYDSPVANIVTTATFATPEELPTSPEPEIGTAYVVTSTNQVWVYTNSTDATAINNYVYNGLNYIPPEFTISLGIPNSTITLSPQGGVDTNVKVTIVKRQALATDIWNTPDPDNGTAVLSLMQSTTVPAKFLQAKPAELPDQYYYGGDLGLVADNGFVLTDQNNAPLQGY